MSINNIIDFKKQVKKVSGPRKHKVKNSLGVRNAFLYLQSHKWLNIGQPLKEQTFQQIIREINNLLAFELMEGNCIVFPEQMGSLEIRKQERYADIIDDKLITNYRVNWDKTLELWSDDTEAYRNKTLVRDINSKNRYIILYNRKSANYNNKSYFRFKPNRALYRVLIQNINTGLILDTYSKNGTTIR